MTTHDKAGLQDVTRHIPWPTRVILVARAGGRCEYHGCNKLLFEHHLTKEDGNFAECAHIIAFKVRGSRGDAARRPDDVHDIANLMLLCLDDHKKIDADEPGHPIEKLERWKTDHEQRIRYLTGLTPEAAAQVLTLRARIGGHLPDPIARGATLEAMLPLGIYPAERDACAIDLTGSHDGNREYYATAAAEIARAVEKMLGAGRLAVFALAPIPLLVQLGSRISNKLPVDFFQRHRDDNSWKWKDAGPEVDFSLRPVRRGTDPKAVGLVVSVSGQIELDTLPKDVDERFSLYELHPSVPPSRDLLRTRQALERFRASYRAGLEQILREHGTLAKLLLFPAVPAPVAIALGHDVLPKSYPTLSVYDNVQPDGFVFALDVAYDVR